MGSAPGQGKGKGSRMERSSMTQPGPDHSAGELVKTMTEQVSAPTQQSTASAHEIADNARNLAATADRLHELVERFVLPASH